MNWRLIILTVTVFVFPINFSLAQTVEETIAKLDSLVQKIEVRDNKLRNEITNNPLFADKDPFETKFNYNTRKRKADRYLRQLRREYFHRYFIELEKHRELLFEPVRIEDINIFLENYDPDQEEYHMRVENATVDNETLNVILPIKREDAKSLYQNWDNVNKNGFLIQYKSQIPTLAKIRLIEPSSQLNVEYSFHEPIATIPVATEIEYSSLYSVSYVSFDSSGRYLYMYSDAGRVFTFDLNTNKFLNTDLLFNDVISIAFSPDKSKIAIGMEDGVCKILNLDSGTELTSFPKTQNGRVSAIAFSPNEKYLVTVTTGTWCRETVFSPNSCSVVNVFDLVLGTKVHSFNYKQNIAITCLDISPKGDYIAIGWYKYKSITIGGGGVEIVELSSGKETYSFKHEFGVNTISFSKDGHFLATGSTEGIKIFNLITGMEVNSGVGGNVNAVTFSPDGLFLLVGYGPFPDYQYKKYGFAIFNRILDRYVYFRRNIGSVKSVSFSSSGKYIVVGCGGGEVYVFRTLFPTI